MPEHPSTERREYRRGEPMTLATGRTHSLVCARPFVTGFNQGWFKNAFGSQWIRNWDEAEARRLLAATAQFGGRVFRIWMFEGLEPEGVIWDGDPTKSAWGYAGLRTLPTGLDNRKRRNFQRFLELCKEKGVRAYITFFDANMYNVDPRNPYPQYERRKNEWWNVLNDKYSAGTGFRENVIKPLLTVAQSHQSEIFGFDLMNEFNALIKKDHCWFEDSWLGAVRFVRTWREYIRRFGRDFKVTASFGHHDAVDSLLSGKLPKDAVDFYDFHTYNDKGDLCDSREESKLRELVSKGTPIYLGEFGQLNPAFDDALQAMLTRQFITRARKVGLTGAFAWRLSDIRPGSNAEARLSYEAYGNWRPAAYEFRAASRTP